MLNKKDKKNKKFFLLLILIIPILCFASGYGIKHGPEQRSFRDYDQLNIVLSNVDVNRISILNDKIQSLNGPVGLYTAKNDASGAAYLTVNAHLPYLFQQ